MSYLTYIFLGSLYILSLRGAVILEIIVFFNMFKLSEYCLDYTSLNKYMCCEIKVLSLISAMIYIILKIIF